MFQNFKQRFNSIPHKGGVIGAIFGALFSVRYLNPGDRPLKNAGKATIFTGAGFLLGGWIEKMLKKK